MGGVGGLLEKLYLRVYECVIGHGGDWPLAQTRLTSDILLPFCLFPLLPVLSYIVSLFSVLPFLF